MSSRARYLFYNVYGDADYLIQTKPDDVILVPFGWTQDIEENRNTILTQLNTSVSALPCVIYWENQNNIEIDGIIQIIPEGWREYRFDESNRPWNWVNVPKKSN